MRILITGINSKLGLLLAKRLSKKHEVIGLGTRDLGSFKTVKFDLSSDKELDLELVDICVHLAFVTDNKICEEDEKAYRTNILGTKKMLDYCKEKSVKKFILASSGGVYGFRDETLDEDMNLNPVNRYSEMKCESESLSKKYTNNFEICILRFFFPYGPNTKKNTLINRLISNIKNGEPILIHKSKKPRINPIFVEDLISSIELFCFVDTGKFNIFNLAGLNHVSIFDIAVILGNLLDKKPLFQYSNEKYKNMIANTQKLSEYYENKTNLRSGLKKTVEL